MNVHNLTICSIALMLCISCSSNPKGKPAEGQKESLEEVQILRPAGEKSEVVPFRYVPIDSLSAEDQFLLSGVSDDIQGYVPEEGMVPTPEVAFQIAEAVLSRIYGKETIEDEMPFLITLENGIWRIDGRLPDEMLGTITYIEIRKSNGEILRVIHGK